MRKTLFISGGFGDTIIQLDHILHLEVSATGTIFFNTQYGEYTLKTPNCSCNGDYVYDTDTYLAILQFYENSESIMIISCDLELEPNECRSNG